MQARAFAPGHITSFFSIHTDLNRPLVQQGSRGSGFCIESGVTTEANTRGPLTVAPAGGASLPFRLQVSDNGTPVVGPQTTVAALRDLVRRSSKHIQYPGTLSLANAYSLPLGAGFGVSGACALTATIAANEALGLSLDRAECVAAAHCGEVEAMSGLGDVGAQSLGGFEARLKEGTPSTGDIRMLDAPDADILLVSWGPRRTREFLSDPTGKDRLNQTGLACLERLMAAPTLENSIRLGRSFAETLGLVSGPAGDLLRRLDPAGPASVAMLGDSVYAVAGKDGEELARRNTKAPFVEATRIARQGARLL